MDSQEPLIKLFTSRKQLSKFSKFFITMSQRISWNKDAWKELKLVEDLMIMPKPLSKELKTTSHKLSQLLITTRNSVKLDTLMLLEPFQKSMLNLSLLSYHKLCSCLDQKPLENLQLEPQWLLEQTWNLLTSIISFNLMVSKVKMTKLSLLISFKA